MAPDFNENTVETATLSWIKGLGYAVRVGPDIAPETPCAERTDYSQVVLQNRLMPQLFRINPNLPPEALDDAFRKLTRPGKAWGSLGSLRSLRDDGE